MSQNRNPPCAADEKDSLPAADAKFVDIGRLPLSQELIEGVIDGLDDSFFYHDLSYMRSTHLPAVSFFYNFFHGDGDSQFNEFLKNARISIFPCLLKEG